MDQLELKVSVAKKLFYSNDSMFGVYALEPVGVAKGIPLNKYGNFVVNGNCPELYIGKQYEIIIEPSESDKYGKGFSFVAVKQKKPTTIDEQQAYLRAMLKEKQAEAIINKYPNHKILDIMKSGEFDYSDIKGIKKITYDKIHKFLFDHLDLQQALVELRELNISFKAMKKLIIHFGSADVTVQKIKENIYSLCEIKSFGFKKVDDYALRRGDVKTNQNRIVAGIRYIVDEEAQFGHSWSNIDTVINNVKPLLEIEESYIVDVINNVISRSKEFYYDNEKIALQQYYFYEKEIYNKLMKMNERDVSVTVNNIEGKIDQLEGMQGIQYTDEQKNTFLLANQNNVLVINGKGGVGKSFSLKGLLRVFQQYPYMCCSLSGKAAKVLENNGLNASTIHRMLRVQGNGKFEFDHKNRLPYRIVVIDEGSMVNSYLFYSVLNALADDAKLIIVGDNGQLASIGTGAVFEDILRTNKLPAQELTIVQRQAAKSGILSSANEIREGNQINSRNSSKQQTYGELKDFVCIPLANRDYIQDIAIKVCHKFLNKDVMEFQVISPLKMRGEVSVRKLNNELQKLFNDTNKKSIKRGFYNYYVGDKIIQGGNNYEAGENDDISVFNGTLGKIVGIDIDEKNGHKVHIQFENMDDVIMYEKDELDMIELAYAITVHRSQGSSIPYVLFVFDYSSYMLLSRQLIYTGISRASKGCAMVCENRALHHAISTDHGGNRRTFLKGFLAEGV